MWIKQKINWPSKKPICHLLIVFGFWGLDCAPISAAPDNSPADGILKMETPDTDNLITVNGIVMDKRETPIGGAFIRIQGEDIRTTADEHGHFSLDVPDGSTMLISYLGMKPVKILIEGRSYFEITMEEMDFEQIESESRQSFNRVMAKQITVSPFISVQQIVKGNMAGVHVQENSGEPGTHQNMLIRGASSPLFSNTDRFSVQPAVYINGVPVIEDHPFIGDLMRFEGVIPGSNTNLLAGIHVDNILSVEVIKDPVKLATLGPLAANGAIQITTRDGYYGGSNFSVSSWLSLAAPPSRIKPTNAAWEKGFRKQLYDRWNIPGEEQYYPSYLREESDINYFGAADWTDDYYRFAPQYNLNASLAGGNRVANYLFAVGTTRNAGVADKTSYQKYNVSYYLNMSPLEGVLASFMLNGTMAERSRNTNVRDRITEMEYIPSLSNPIPPSGDSYALFLKRNKETEDDNQRNHLSASLNVNYNRNNVYVNGHLSADYNTDSRHVFWPSTLTESVSFITDFSGFNRRLITSGHAGYILEPAENHRLDIRLEGSILADLHNYNYTRAYDGDNDKYKTNLNGNYNRYIYKDKEQLRIASSSLLLNYNWKERVTFSALFRTDGTSATMPDGRWLFSPAFSAEWDIKNSFLKNLHPVNTLQLNVSWAKIGQQPVSDRFSLGPQYSSSEMGWRNDSFLSSWNNYATITRPYSSGWIGYDYNWAYAEKLDIQLSGSILKDRLAFTIGYYNNLDKNRIVRTPVPREFGYEYQYQRGMEINNRGLEINLSTSLPANPRGLSWDASWHVAWNRNELKKLPGNRNEVVLNGRKLQVGEAIDRFWVYENRGIYTGNGDIPVDSEGNKLSFNGIDFREGDPVWADQNGDNRIDTSDKVLKGHSLPPVTGGWINKFRYRNFDLNIHLFFAAGHSALNYRDAQRYDFMNLDRHNTIASVKEIFFWQNGNQRNDYPLYHPLSEIQPYRVDQDLFLEKLSYLKLRTLSLGYTIPKPQGKKIAGFADDWYIYLTANNLFTLTGFSGNDPEGVEIDGYYTGYAHPVPRSFTVGFRFNF